MQHWASGPLQLPLSQCLLDDAADAKEQQACCANIWTGIWYKPKMYGT